MNQTLFSGAKLTKYLSITGTRSNGMHELESEMVSLSFGDTLEIRKGEGLTIVDSLGWLSDSQENLFEEIPTDDRNLISKALSLVGKSFHVVVNKVVPPGAGLGGGSSNAAAILRHFEGSQGVEKASQLGADVAFCVVGGRAKVEGAGDIVTPLSYKRETYVLLLSPFGVSTKEVYLAFDKIGRGRGDSTNDLELAAETCEPRLKESKRILAELSGKKPMLAGSGSTYFISGELNGLAISGEPKSCGEFLFFNKIVNGVIYHLVEATTMPPFI